MTGTLADIHALIDAYTSPVVARTDETGGWRTSPSLWDQLAANTSRRGGEGTAVARSRPPVTTSVLSIVDDTERTTAAYLRTLRRPLIWRERTEVDTADCYCRTPFRMCPNRPHSTRSRDIRAELHAIAADPTLTASRARLEEWCEHLTRWVAQAQLVLEGAGPLGWLRSVACIDCGAQTHTQVIGGERIVTPALQLVWRTSIRGTELLDRVRCVACGRERWPADLHLIADRNRTHQLTKETMTA